MGLSPGEGVRERESKGGGGRKCEGREEREERGEEVVLLEEMGTYTDICNGVILLHVSHDMLIFLHTAHPQFIYIEQVSLWPCDLPSSALNVPTMSQALR